MRRTDTSDGFAVLGLEPLDIGAARFPDFVGNQLSLWSQAAKEAGLVPE